MPESAFTEFAKEHHDRRLVLIIDDSPQNIELLQAYLEHLPLTLLAATSGQQALVLIDRHRPNLILLDIMMPKMSGLQLCRRLKSSPATCTIPILITTALNEISDIEAAKDAGADDFISKPISRFELIARVQWLLDSAIPPTSNST